MIVIPMSYGKITPDALGVPEQSFIYGKAVDGSGIMAVVEFHSSTELTVSYKDDLKERIYEVPRDQLEIQTPKEVLTDLEEEGTFTYLDMAEGGNDE